VSVALIIRHAKRISLIIFSSVAFSALLKFSSLSHKRYDFRKNVIGHKTRVLIFSKLCVTHLILKRINLYCIINIHRSSLKVPVILVRF